MIGGDGELAVHGPGGFPAPADRGRLVEADVVLAVIGGERQNQVAGPIGHRRGA